MSQDIKYKKYQRKSEYSYTLGAFPTIELLKNKWEKVECVFFHPDMNSDEQKRIVTELCEEHNIPLEVNKKIVERLRDKDNCFCVGIFNKYDEELDSESMGHIVLVNPSDMGNLGTIIRTAIGFGINDIAIIEPAVDIFNPKVVRSSMGALFQLRFHRFNSFEEYKSVMGNREVYPFMLKGATELQRLERDDKEANFALIYGNEATGLSDEYAEMGTSVLIRHMNTIDSLNLSMAVGISLYEFTKANMVK